MATIRDVQRSVERTQEAYERGIGAVLQAATRQQKLLEEIEQAQARFLKLADVAKTVAQLPKLAELSVAYSDRIRSVREITRKLVDVQKLVQPSPAIAAISRSFQETFRLQSQMASDLASLASSPYRQLMDLSGITQSLTAAIRGPSVPLDLDEVEKVLAELPVDMGSQDIDEVDVPQLLQDIDVPQGADVSQTVTYLVQRLKSLESQSAKNSAGPKSNKLATVLIWLILSILTFVLNDVYSRYVSPLIFSPATPIQTVIRETRVVIKEQIADPSMWTSMRIVTRHAVVRAGSKARSEQVGWVQPGQVVTLIEKVGERCRIEWQDAAGTKPCRGWVLSKYLVQVKK